MYVSRNYPETVQVIRGYEIGDNVDRRVCRYGGVERETTLMLKIELFRCWGYSLYSLYST